MSNERQIQGQQVAECIERAIKQSAECAEVAGDVEFIRAQALEIHRHCAGRMTIAFELVIWVAIQLGLARDQALGVVTELKKTLMRNMSCERVYSEPFTVGTNGESVRLIYTAPAGRESSGFNCVELPDDVEAPPLLSFGFTVDGKRWEGMAPAPPLPQEEYEVLSVERVSATQPQLSELKVSANGHSVTRHAAPELAQDVEQRLGQGHKVTVLADRAVVSQILESKADTPADFLEILSAEGITLDDVVLPVALRRKLDDWIEAISEGQGICLRLAGPTGTGKTMTVNAFGRSVGRRTGKPVAMITIGAAWTGSEYVNVSEKTMRAAVARAKALTNEGHVVVIHVPEIDGWVGACANRFEGTHNRSVRTVFQELFSEAIPGVAVIATQNYSRDSYLPDAIARRFITVEYGRPTRKALALVAAKQTSADVLQQRLGISPEQFGNRVADGLAFPVARCHFTSGKTREILARDLTAACPAKIKALAADFCRDLRRGKAQSFNEMLARLEREFCAVELNERNLFDATFLNREEFVHDSVALVQRVGAAHTGGLVA